LCPFPVSNFLQDLSRRRNRNCNRPHHKDHSRPEHSRPSGHSQPNSSPSAEYTEHIRHRSSRRNQLPTIRQTAKDSKRWLNRTLPRRNQPPKLSQSIASFGIRLAAERRHKKRLLLNAATTEATPDRALPRSPGLHEYRAGKTSLIDILIKVTEFITA
jgi:hypothetical protein